MEPLKLVNEEALRQRIAAEVERILDERANPIYRDVPGKTAHKEVEDFLLAAKERGVTRVAVPDVVRALHLPPEQVETILEGFEKQGRLKEVLD